MGVIIVSFPVQFRKPVVERGKLCRLLVVKDNPQWKEEAAISLRIKRKLEFRWIRPRAFLIRRQNASFRSGHRDRGGETGVIGVEYVISAIADPLGIRRSEVGRRPHAHHFWLELKGQAHGP